MIGKSAVVVMCACGLAFAGQAYAEAVVVNIASGQATTRAAETAGLSDCYILNVVIPEELMERSITAATLEFYVDADVVDSKANPNESPKIEVYALNSTMSGAVDLEMVNRGGPSIVNVPVGTNQMVKVDITGIIRGYVSDPKSNHGLVIGALTGARDGLFTLKANVIPGGNIAQVRIYCRP